MRFYNASPRQITLSAVRDGFEMRGVVVKIVPTQDLPFDTRNPEQRW